MSPVNTTSSPPPLRRAHRATLWLALIATTIMDAALLTWVAVSYGDMAAWWLLDRLRHDPLVGLLALEAIALRFAVALTAVQAAPLTAMRGYAAWAMFVPVLGAPLALAAVLAIEDP